MFMINVEAPDKSTALAMAATQFDGQAIERPAHAGQRQAVLQLIEQLLAPMTDSEEHQFVVRVTGEYSATQAYNHVLLDVRQTTASTGEVRGLYTPA